MFNKKTATIPAPVTALTPGIQTGTTTVTAPVVVQPKIAPVVVTPVTAAAAKPAAVVAAVPATPSPSVAALIKALRDPSADAAREAAIALGKLGDAAAVAPLIEVVTNASGYFHSVVRAAACASLGQLRDRAATPALLNAVRDPMAEASAEAVRALATLADERAVEPLTAVLRNERGFYLPVVRLAAVRALHQFKTPLAAAALKVVAANVNEDPVLRSAAA